MAQFNEANTVRDFVRDLVTSIDVRFVPGNELPRGTDEVMLEGAVKAALKRAKLGTDQIDYVNAHGTSTMADVIELGAVKRAFGEDAYKLSMSSTKSATGHLLGAAGAIEAIYAIKSINEQAVPPTLNLDDPDEGCDIDLVPKQAKQRKVRYALSNSFGFGGTNASLIVGAV